MKKGFTMIELVFVIVILGILAAVAIPRLAATRDDAEVAKAATNLSTLLGDVGAYYTSQGKFGTLAEMTNVPLTSANELLAAGKKCLKVTLTSYNATTNKPANVKVEQGDDKTESICTAIYKNSGVDKLLTNKFKWSGLAANAQAGTAPSEQTSDAGEYPVSGLSVAF
ncbi:Type II secretion envelope pseudopilin protein [Campylobacter concisus UNSW2]|uniref:Type II secretion envelope pseudopilin protein n=2 Tax=Campylobacter concisus TaxID=199 RepID=U2F6N2_9BACT|nr:prepilin-type N-terminal cleavage/methylation domain-containing protein [Campylobacter concisus]ERJ32226.1 Type II secretion envelope pseudopilin protein [Campylobacter concisus UNSW2]